MATEAQYRKRGYSADRAHARAMSDYYEAVNASRYRDSGRQPRDRRGRFVKMRLSEE